MQKHLPKSLKSKDDSLLTLRDAAALIMNPDNPRASYSTIDESVARIARVYEVTTSIFAIVIGVAVLATLWLLWLVWSNTIVDGVPVTLCIIGILSVIGLALFNPPVVGRTPIWRWAFPPEPEAMRDLMDRLARGELTAEWGDDHQAFVKRTDIEHIIADRKTDAAQPSSVTVNARHNRAPLNCAIKLKAEMMPDGAEIVEPETIAEMNACRGNAYIKINDAIAFILDAGDPAAGAAQLRRMERRTNSIIRQPDNQYMTVGSLRTFLKNNNYEGVTGSPWDRV